MYLYGLRWTIVKFLAFLGISESIQKNGLTFYS